MQIALKKTTSVLEKIASLFKPSIILDYERERKNYLAFKAMDAHLLADMGIDQSERDATSFVDFINGANNR